MSEQIIGIPHKRVDGRLKLTGSAQYAADHPLPGMLFAYGVYSEVASGTITNIHDETARAMPGVVAVLHHGKSDSGIVAPSAAAPIRLRRPHTSSGRRIPPRLLRRCRNGGQ